MINQRSVTIVLKQFLINKNQKACKIDVKIEGVKIVGVKSTGVKWAAKSEGVKIEDFKSIGGWGYSVKNQVFYPRFSHQS